MDAVLQKHGKTQIFTLADFFDIIYMMCKLITSFSNS